jgi:hypothetical protein
MCCQFSIEGGATMSWFEGVTTTASPGLSTHAPPRPHACSLATLLHDFSLLSQWCVSSAQLVMGLLSGPVLSLLDGQTGLHFGEYVDWHRLGVPFLFLLLLVCESLAQGNARNPRSAASLRRLAGPIYGVVLWVTGDLQSSPRAVPQGLGRGECPVQTWTWWWSVAEWTG